MVMSNESSRLEGAALLRRMGEDLDRGIFPDVYRGGHVELGAAALISPPGNGVRNERGTEGIEGTKRDRSEGARQGPRPWSGPGSSETRTTAPVVRKSGLTSDEEMDLQGMRSAYPDMRVRLVPSGIFVTGVVRPIRGLSAGATLHVFIPLDRALRVQGWAWWDTGVWIGPRHTNYPNGSICAFEPADGTWTRGQTIIRLLDLYVVWVARHLHLQLFGRWPGDQVLHTTHERLHENGLEEFCGCGSGEQYKRCCYQLDVRRSPADVRQEFSKRYPKPDRRPVLPST